MTQMHAPRRAEGFWLRKRHHSSYSQHLLTLKLHPKQKHEVRNRV